MSFEIARLRILMLRGDGVSGDGAVLFVLRGSSCLFGGGIPTASSSAGRFLDHARWSGGSARQNPFIPQVLTEATNLGPRLMTLCPRSGENRGMFLNGERKFLEYGLSAGGRERPRHAS